MLDKRPNRHSRPHLISSSDWTYYPGITGIQGLKTTSKEIESVKSLEYLLLGLYDALIDDVCAYYPGDIVEWRRDRSHLHKIIEARGSKFITIDLVACGKHFDKCLSQASFKLSGYPHQGGRRKGSQIPRLFGGLVSKVFNEDGMLRDDVDTLAASLLRQLYYAGKKVKHEPDPSTTYSVVEEFFDIEGHCRNPDLRWDLDNLDCESNTGISLSDSVFDLQSSRNGTQLDFGFSQEGACMPDRNLQSLLGLCQQLADLVSIDLGEFTGIDCFPRHGPGAVCDVKGWVSKYSFPHWPHKLETVFPATAFAFANESQYLDHAGLETRLDIGEPPSRLICVPKTQKGPRLIASEPSSHQWAQQGGMLWLRERLKKSLLRRSVDFLDQRKSQRAVLRASQTGRGCSIDLSSASDRLSLWAIERIFRKNHSFLRMLHSSRTRWVENRIDKKSERFLILKKFAPMGSALTFPVQSMVYATICIACTIATLEKSPFGNSSRWLRKAAERAGPEVTVFGDDLIVPEAAFSRVSEVLTFLGLKVNTDKTFVGGNFYESCGMDAYKGVDVTPSYFLQTATESDPSSVVSVIESSNNFYFRGLWRTSQWLIGRIPEKYRNFIGVDRIGQGPLGLKSICIGRPPLLKEKWNDSLHKWEELRLTGKSTVRHSEDPGTHVLLQYFTEDPRMDQLWEHGRAYDGKVKLARKYVTVSRTEEVHRDKTATQVAEDIYRFRARLRGAVVSSSDVSI